ncbi:MAG: hypothetical protein A3K19_06305 [Lentisphaerae bacterium RIFOXYB12_FULL_65_16]|nr:MAG: hypothetical protein A3K18_26740 [Lentisphaerae bacterium RIFOXYA12_64_32]OGV93234.1 MAG: hypothetical protein A3K19_06305 [Lentisphaerae bacterium RIFOXYB12_FULL_65_16]
MLRHPMLGVALWGLAVGAAATASAALEVLDRPLWVFPGQPFRVCLGQAAGSGELAVEVPPSLTLYDRWDQDAIQRYYFRALAPGKVDLKFTGKGGELTVDIEVLAWADVFQPHRHKALDLPRLWPLGVTDYGELKQQRTLHTDAEMARLRATPAGPPPRWATTDDEAIFNTIPGPAVPRTCLISMSYESVGKGCPVCRMKIHETHDAFYPWVFDPEKHPWQVQCPSCQTWFPLNKWHEGDMHSGAFPDDGFGCEPVVPIKDAAGKLWRWPFIAYYHQWQSYMREFTPEILKCARAAVATGDKALAHKAAIALFRMAESHLDMAVNLNHRKIPNRDGILQWPVGAPQVSRFDKLAGGFLYIQPNWDTPRMEDAARAWDLIFDQLEGDAALLAFCQAHHHPEIQTVEDFRRFVDAGILRVPLQACLDNAISRNYPMQEVTAVTLAVALATPRTLEIADHVLNRVGVRFALTNEYYIDGSAHESPGYNGIQIRDMARLFETLERLRQLHPDLYVPPRFVSPAQDPKFRRQYDFPLEFSLIGRTFPVIGDTGQAGPPRVLPPAQGFPCEFDDWVSAYKLTRDPRFAQAMYGPNGVTLNRIEDPQLREAAAEAGRTRGWQVQVPSNILDGYGHAILRSGEGEHQRAFWVRYSQAAQHVHWDMLTIGLAAMQRDLLPELGYPRGWNHAAVWENSWGTHYGTHITGVPANAFNKGELTTFVATAPVQVAAAESRATVNGKPVLRQRLIALVDLPPTAFYAVTIERVQGGEEQTFSFHGPDGEATAVNVAQQRYEGTALGEGLALNDFSSVVKTDRDLACLAFMREPSRATPSGVWALDYALRDQPGLNLRMTCVEPEGGELVVAKAKAPGGKCNYDLTWAILRQKGTAPLARQYVTVLEPYAGQPVLTRIERVPVTGGAADAPFPPLALRITAGTNVDTILLQYQAGPEMSADGITCNGEFGLFRESQGRLATAALVRGTGLMKAEVGVTLEAAEYQGTIVACDWREAIVTVEPPPCPGTLTGRHMRITNEHGSSSSYQIVGVEPAGNQCRIKLALDPRIGEGFVQTCRDGVLVSATHLRLYLYDYYAGKTLANETGTQWFRLKNVEKGSDCVILPPPGATAPNAAQLDAAFSDGDADGLRRFAIYDYGPGDRVTMEAFATCGAQESE